MEKNIEPGSIKTELGALKILAVFLTDKQRQILGGKVFSGEIKKGSKLEVFRGEDFMGVGKMVNLQKNKKDVSVVKSGEECGLIYEGSARVEEGDVLKFFIKETQQGTL